tara:strand:+ start:470 stop:2701 length:2232 start_codon:yes stop_codon:yes gene_type:complete
MGGLKDLYIASSKAAHQSEQENKKVRDDELDPREKILNAVGHIITKNHSILEAMKAEEDALSKEKEESKDSGRINQIDRRLKKVDNSKKRLNNRYDSAKVVAVSILAGCDLSASATEHSTCALGTPENAIQAANIIERWNDVKACGWSASEDGTLQQNTAAWSPEGVSTEDALTAVINNNRKARPAALKALTLVQADAAKHKSLYRDLLNTPDPKNEEVSVFRLAIKQLGDIIAKNPNQIDFRNTVAGIVRGLFLKAHDNEVASAAARSALATIGAPAIDLIKALVEHDRKGEYGKEVEDFVNWTKRQRIPEWRWRYGPELMVVLADQRSPRAAQIIATSLSARLSLRGIRQSQRAKYVTAQMQRIQIGLTALMKFPNTVSLDPVIPTLKKFALSYKDAGSDEQLYLKSAWALAVIGTKPARKALFDVFSMADDAEIKRKLVRFIALGMHKDDWKQYKKTVLGAMKKNELLAQERSENVIAYEQTVASCGSDVGCYWKMFPTNDRCVKECKSTPKTADCLVDLNLSKDSITKAVQLTNAVMKQAEEDRKFVMERAVEALLTKAGKDEAKRVQAQSINDLAVSLKNEAVRTNRTVMTRLEAFNLLTAKCSGSANLLQVWEPPTDTASDDDEGSNQCPAACATLVRVHEEISVPQREKAAVMLAHLSQVAPLPGTMSQWLERAFISTRSAYRELRSYLFWGLLRSANKDQLASLQKVSKEIDGVDGFVLESMDLKAFNIWLARQQ